MSGRPLRFLGVVITTWVAARALLLWPWAPDTKPMIASPRPMTSVPPHAGAIVTSSKPRRVLGPAPVIVLARAFVAPPRLGWQRHPGDPDRVALALLGLTRIGAAEPRASAATRDDPPTATEPAFPRPTRSASRLSGSAWLIARPGDGLGQSPLGGQLGGSQAGFRVAYAIDRQRRLALVGRVASPLAGPGREGAFGIEWQPTRAPIRLVAEQRVAIDGSGGGPTIGVVGGVGPMPLGDFRLEAYGQAGVIGRARGVAYADGALRVERPIATHHGISVAAGVGAWGAAQPGAERLDIGPLVSVQLPIAQRRLRLSLEWRARIGGQALPGSGVALSLGSDF